MDAPVLRSRAASAAWLCLALFACAAAARVARATPRQTVRMLRLEETARAESLLAARRPIPPGGVESAPGAGTARPAQEVRGAPGLPGDSDALGVREDCPTFLEPDSYATPGYVFATAVADFDGDGRPDVAAAIAGDSVRILPNLGGGRLGPGIACPTGNRLALAAADLDRDGRPDLVAGGPEGVTVLRNTVSGFQASEVGAALPFGGSITLADLDGDGDLDMVIPAGSSLLVYRNDGSGSFAPSDALAASLEVAQVAAADLDGDGRVDLVARGSPPGIAVLMNQGAAGFVRLGVHAPAGPFALADLDQDGIPDLLCAPPGDSLAFLRGAGDGTFGPARPAGAAVAVQALAPADLDGDGRAEVLGWSPFDGDPVSVLAAVGGGRVTRLDGYALGGQVRGVSAADLDGDGRPDLVAGNGEGRLVVARGRGAARLGARGQQEAGDFASGVVAADLDGDGVLDLATATYWSNVCRVFRGRGDGSFDPPRSSAVPVYPVGIVAAELTGDGRPDLLTLSADDPQDILAVQVNDGHGGFAPGPQWNLRRLGCVPEALATADVDGDGRPDVVVAGAPGAVLMRGAAPGLLADPVALPSGPCDAVAAGDLDGDGWPDLVLSSSAGRLWVLRNDGRGGFPDSIGYACPDPASLAVADLDGDGRDDLAVAQWTQPRIRLYLGSAQGALRRAPDVPLASSVLPTTVVAAPPRPGAVADLLVAAYAAADPAVSPLVLLRNEGGATFSATCLSRLDPAANGAVAADLDGDGALDLAVAHGNPNRRQVYVTVALRHGPEPGAVRAIVPFESHAAPDRVHLAWRADGVVDAVALERSEAGRWTRRALLRPDEHGLLQYDDTQVRPGARYGYRLVLAWEPAPIVTGVTWLQVPAWDLALAPVFPNPAHAEAARVSFRLAGDGAARLQLLDVAGRVVLSRDLRGLGPGAHEQPLGGDPGLAPGVYFLRLTESGRSASTRVVLAR